MKVHVLFVIKIVEMLTAEECLDTSVVNKFGETALDVVGTRAKVKNTKSEQRIKELVEGLMYIPIYRDVDDMDGWVKVGKTNCLILVFSRSCKSKLD